MGNFPGVEFGHAGTEIVKANFDSLINNIRKAPLKPKQRIRILRVHLIPRLYHATVLGKTTAGRLKAFDITIRRCVREWLHLPSDVPEGFFHAATEDGDLGIPSCLLLIPSMVTNRLTRLRDSTFAAAREAYHSPRIKGKLKWANKLLRKLDISPTPDATTRRNHWATRLHESVDGRELASLASLQIG